MVDLFAEQGTDQMGIVPVDSLQFPFLQRQPGHLFLKQPVLLSGAGIGRHHQNQPCQQGEYGAESHLLP